MLDWDGLIPTEVVSCLHPVRWYQTPDKPAFACVFARPLPAGAPVALYTGVVRRENRHEEWRASDVYVWDLGNDSHCIIDAGEKGGAARFINAEMYRIGGESTVNLRAVDALDADLRMPTVALETTCVVSELAEGICDYGQRYWPAIKQHLVEVWTEYVDMARYVHQVTAEYMRLSGLSFNRLPVPLPANEDEAYHWAPDEVQYPVWPVSAASTDFVPSTNRRDRFGNPVKRTTRP